MTANIYGRVLVHHGLFSEWSIKKLQQAITKQC